MLSTKLLFLHFTTHLTTFKQYSTIVLIVNTVKTKRLLRLIKINLLYRFTVALSLFIIA